MHMSEGAHLGFAAACRAYLRRAPSRVQLGLRAISVFAASLTILVSLTWVAGANAAPPGMRDAVLVGNAASGTVSLLDGHAPWTDLGYINVTPAPVSPLQQQQCDFSNSQEGGV